MTYQPVVPFSGFAGWSFLNRTIEVQKAAFTGSREVQSNEAYFREKIGSIQSAEALVDDRRLLTVALGAFGLDEDIDNRFFVRKVLDEGTLDTTALANKLTDKRYLALSAAFGFGDFDTPRTVLSDFPDEILAQYEDRQFERAVGDADGDMRLALALQRDLPDLANRSTTEATKWFSIIGSPVLSEVFRTAFSLPESVSSLDLDRQLQIYSEKAEAFFGDSDPAQFSDPQKLERLTRDFLLRSQLDTSTALSSQDAALTLLQGMSGGSNLSLLL